jgi:hypothetical protein
MTPTQYHSDFDKKLEEKLNELGVSSKDYRELYWNSHMVQGKEDNETKYSARTLPLPKEQVEGYDKIEDADPTMNKIKERNPEIMPLIPLIKNLKNKNRLLLNLETPERNFEDMAGKDAGEFKRVLTDPVKKAEADMVRFVNNLFDDIRKFKIKAGSKESAAAQKFGEGMYVTVDNDNNVKNHKYGMDELTKDIPDARQRQNVIDYVEFMKKTYEDLFTTANEVLKRNGNREIPHRNNYFPHIQDVDGIWQSLQKAVGLENTELPTDINGLTADFSPGKPWFSHFMERTGDRTAYDAVRGADVYITGIAKVIYLTDHIKRLRNFEKAIRDVYKGQTKLSDFAAYIHEWTNILAG